MHCKQCGQELPEGTSWRVKYCSPACRKESRTQQQNSWYLSNKDKPDFKEKAKIADSKFKDCNKEAIRKKALKRYHEKYKNSPEYKKNQRLVKEKLFQDPSWRQVKKLKDQEYYRKNSPLIKARVRQYKQENKALIRKWIGSRKKVFKLATPKWLSKEQREEMEHFYWLASDLKRVTGFDYHVDHIIPLQGENVCGLHVPWNLQVLPSYMNLSKGNKLRH